MPCPSDATPARRRPGRRLGTRGPRWRGLLAAVCGGALLGGCVQTARIFPFSAVAGGAEGARGSVQIERIEGDQRLLAVRFEDLAPPETWGADRAEFVAWAQDSRGVTVKVGALSYDRARRRATLLGAVEGIDFRAFTVKVTAEREAGVKQPSRVLLSERRVMNQ